MQLFTVTIFILTIAATATLVRSDCRSEKFEHFEVQCKRRAGDYNVEVICLSDDWNPFPKFQLDLSSAAELIFKNCSFSTTTNLQNIIHSMKIISYNSIILVGQQSIPNRQNFKDLDTPNFYFFLNNFDELPSDLLYDVQNIETLQIIRTRLTRIPENFFSNWAENVTQIYLNNNQLRKIAENDVKRVPNLKIMDLSNNAIEEIEFGAFESLVRLETLKLQSNRLRTLPSDIFHQMISVVKIDMNENLFDELPQDLFKNTKNLMDFTMRDNKGSLSSLPQGFFKNLTQLKHVRLDDNHLQSVPMDLFGGCSALEHIDLSGNQLTNLPSTLFADTKRLISIHVYSNKLESLPGGIFKELDSLKFLHVGNNQLTSLTPDVLDGLQSVEDFNASHNNLTWLDDRFLEYLKSATQIDLSSNQLAFENRNNSILQQRNLVSLIKNQKRILNKNPNVLDDDYDVILESRSIDLRNNKISQFDVGLISMLMYSNSIDLRDNQISKINLSNFSSEMVARNVTFNGVTTTRYLKIHLEDNPIQCDCDLADFVRYLKTENQLYKIFISDQLTCKSPSELEERRIQEIHLEDLNCPLKTDDDNDACNEICVCREYPEKQTLSVDCSYRNLTQVPLIIGNMQNYSIVLNMTGNMLKYAPSLKDSHLKNVTSLDLSNNNITEVTMDLFSPKLQQLKLHGNSLSRLDLDIIEFLSHNNTLSSITLHDNEWICDCKSHQFLSFVQKKFTSYDFHEIRCYGSNRKLYKMTVNELCEGVIMFIVITSLSFAILGIAIASFVALYYKYERQVKIWLYSKQLCLWFVTEDELDKDKEYDAFISFSHKDEDFVEKEIVDKLEGGPRPYKLCLHYRDWLAGEWIPVQISRSVEKSRRTIVVLTPNFLESVWGLLEFRAAHTQALKEGRTRLIVILCGDIGNIDNLDEEMKDYLRQNTYIKWGDPWFWDKLRYALPHAKELPKKKSLTNGIDADAIQIPDIISIPKLTTAPSNASNPANPSTEDESLIDKSYM